MILKYREFTIANQGRIVRVVSQDYVGLAVYTGLNNRFEDTVFIRVGTLYHTVSYYDIKEFVPQGNLTEALYG